MAFKDRLHFFTRTLPNDLALYLRDQKHVDMESVYESARQWVSRRFHQSNPPSSTSSLTNKSKSRGKSIFRSRRSEPKKITTTVKPSSDDDLDALDAIQLHGIHCYNCGELGHFSKDCKKPRNIKPKRNFKSKAKAFYQTAEIGSEQESEVHTDSESSNNNDSEVAESLGVMSLYEIADNGESAVTKSSKLPIFDAQINKTHIAKTIIDTGASTIYISQKFALQIDAKITKITPRRIQVADKEIITATGICTVTMKLGDLPPESITAYTFPLQKIDLVLGLPWLQRHNPHVDFRDMRYEFTRNGRSYYVYPSKPSPEIKITGAKDFINYIEGEKDMDLYLLRPNEEETPLLLGKTERKGKVKKLLRKARNYIANITSWIKSHCPNLLRLIGIPAKLQSFTINTGDKEPIRIRPRAHSPLDLIKIKKFLDENLKKRRYFGIRVTLECTYRVGYETKRRYTCMCRLSSTESYYGKGCTSNTSDR